MGEPQAYICAHGHRFWIDMESTQDRPGFLASCPVCNTVTMADSPSREFDTADDAFADARQVQAIAERIWKDEHPGEPFPLLADDRLRDLYNRAKREATG